MKGGVQMANAVLLKGFLDREKIYAAVRDISLCLTMGEQEVILVIDSDGGNISPAVDFISFMEKSEKHGLSRLGVKIYNAKSMAALIAIAVTLPEYREMSEKTILEFHRGTLQLEASDFDLKTGQISPEILEQFVTYNDILRASLGSRISDNQKLMAEFYASNWLRLSAERCLELGLVGKIF